MVECKERGCRRQGRAGYSGSWPPSQACVTYGTPPVRIGSLRSVRVWGF